MHATFDTRGISFTKYPFPAASVYRSGLLAYSAIRDVDPQAAPPEIRTFPGETLFVSAEQVDEFKAAIRTANLAIVRRFDVWDLLLEPFLDTEFTLQQQEQTLQVLEQAGIPRHDAADLRRRVERAMLSYNLFLWEWCHLGLFDLLTATRQGLNRLSLTHLVSRKRYHEFYWEAMRLADQGRNINAEDALRRP